MRAIDRGLVAAARRELGFVVPVGATVLERRVWVRARSRGGAWHDANAHVKWRTRDGRVAELRITASDDSLRDPRNIALAFLLGKLERVRPGTTVSAAKTSTKKASTKRASTTRKTPRATKPKRALVEKVTSARTRKRPLPRRGQIARAANRKLLARVDELVDRRVPDGCTEKGRSVQVYRVGPAAFTATAFLVWKTPRGKELTFREAAAAHGDDAPNLALRALIAKLAAESP